MNTYHLYNEAFNNTDNDALDNLARNFNRRGGPSSIGSSNIVKYEDFSSLSSYDDSDNFSSSSNGSNGSNGSYSNISYSDRSGNLNNSKNSINNHFSSQPPRNQTTCSFCSGSRSHRENFDGNNENKTKLIQITSDELSNILLIVLIFILICIFLKL